MNILWLATAEMESKSYMSTSFQSERSATPILEEKDPNEDPQCYERPQETMYSELSDYSHLSRSVQSTQQLIRPAEQTMYVPNRLYDTAEETALNQQPYNARIATGTKPRRSVQNSAGKRFQIVTIVLLVLILLLLILVVVMMLLSFHLSLKDSCTCDSNSARITNNVNGIDCVTNSSLTLLQDKINGIDCVTNSSLTLLQDKINGIDCVTNSSLTLLQDKINGIDCVTNSSLTLLQDKINGIDCVTNSSLTLLQDKTNGIDCVTNSSLTLLQDNILEQMIVLDDRAAHNRTLINNTILHQMENQQRTLYEIKKDGIPTAAAVEDILRLLAVDKLLALEEEISCSDIKKLIPSSPSGYYHVNITRYIYCNMEELCGEEGGWTRLAHLNMSDIKQNCPPGLEEQKDEGIRLCRIEKTSAGCSESIKFPTNGISYTHICGRVIGYQKGEPEALLRQSKRINSAYLDGVSITRGSPREHVWSFIAGRQSNDDSNRNCPCNNGSNVKIEEFIGNHYYCESGSDSEVSNTSKLYSSDPLWDGKKCPSFEAFCCKSPNLPWFHRDYGNARSTDYLELRVCRSGSRNNEDIPLQLYEIYVK